MTIHAIDDASYAMAKSYLKQTEAVLVAYQVMSSGHRAQLRADFPTLSDALEVMTTIRAEFDTPTTAAPTFDVGSGIHGTPSNAPPTP